MNKQANVSLGVFPPTHWTSILLAGRCDDPAGHQALSRLLERYQAPLLLHLQWRFRCTEDQAEDWFQGFVEKKVLEKELLTHAQRSRGRFRTFLLSALDNFVKDELRRELRDKRMPSGGFHSGHFDEGEQPFAQKNADPFDVTWARTVLDETISRMQKFYEKKERNDLWSIFDLGFLLPTLQDGERPSMTELAARLGFQSADAASNGLVTAKRQFKKTLEKVIEEYVENSSSVEAEIDELMQILANTG
jgi:DNA-directed RNA polymerase specialized sigma24 family protein